MIQRLVTDAPLPVEPATTDGGARQRDSVARLTSVSNVAAIVASAVVGVLAVRVTLPALGAERYGLWMTAVGLCGLLSVADLGVANALVNRIAVARAQRGGDRLATAVTGGLGVLAALGLVTSAVAALACHVIPWEHLFRPPQDPRALPEFRVAVVLLGLLFGVHVFTSGIRKIYEGLQQGYVVHLLTCVSACISLGLMLWVAAFDGGTPLLLAVTFGTTAIGPLALLLPLSRRHLFSWRRVCGAALAEAPYLLHVGWQYLIVQLGTIVLQGSEPLLITSLRGSDALTSLAVTQRLFTIAATPGRVWNAPYWAAYADASARGDRGYIRSTFLHLLGASGALTAVLAVAAAVVAPFVLPLWTDGILTADTPLLLACCGLCIVEGFLTPLGVYLNGIACVRPQAVATIFALFTFFPLKILALAWAGVPAMLWTAVALHACVFIVFYAFVFRTQVWSPLQRT